MPSYDPAQLKADLTRDEQRKHFAYDDGTGNAPPLKGHGLTIGIGYNLTAKGLPDDLIDLLYDRSVAQAERDCDQVLPNWRELLDPVRQLVLMNMAFNMGATTLAKFHDFLGALLVQDWPKAAAAMQDSTWWTQVGARAQRLQAMILSGMEG